MKDSLGDRMKQYEATSKQMLIRRTPVIIRVDGRAFHTWTRQLKGFDESILVSPFSELMHTAMTDAMVYTMTDMQNALFGYTQSDEISFFLNDWEALETQHWFGGNVQKIASNAAATVTATFVRSLFENKISLLEHTDRFPTFDARVFQLPKDEVANYFVWRQKDAIRNSINMLARYYFSHKDLHGKSCSEMQDMLMINKGVNWNDLKTWMKRGSCSIRVRPADSTGILRPVLKLDEEIPIFTKDRDYIERFL